MSEDNVPDWLAELAKGSEALRRQVQPLVEAAEQFVRDSRRAKTTGGPALPFAQRVALAVDAGIRELLLAPGRPVVEVPLNVTVTAGLATAVATAPAPTVTFSGGVALAPLRASGQFTIENPPSGQAERSVGQILALVLVAIATSGLLGVQGPDQAAVGYYLTVIGLALTIAVIIWNWNKNK
jgi:hypothetical protein